MPFIEYSGKRILFLHIPKAAGTTIEKWLSENATLRFHSYGIPPFSKVTPQHLTYTDITNLFGNGYFNYCFTLARNPFDRIESEYKMQWINGRKGFFGGFPPFPYWLENALAAFRNNRHHQDNHFRPQVDYLHKDVRIFRLEDGLEPIYKELGELFGLAPPRETRRVYNTDTFEGDIDWSTADILKVQKEYRQDFDMFRYELRVKV